MERRPLRQRPSVLLENSGLLLIAAEDGQVVLLRADPKQHAELASSKALEGKTWTGLHKVAEVLFGCIVGLLVSWLMSKVWLVQTPTEREQPAGAQVAIGQDAVDEKRTKLSPGART
jgi:hypothetical protein